MKTLLITTAMAAALGLAACGPPADQAATPPSETTADVTTPITAAVDPAAKTLDFATKAAKLDMIEIETSKVAATKSPRAEVKKFATMMVADHTRTTAELKDWAGKTTVALPAALEGLDQATVDNIRNADVAGFDDKYLDTIIDAHEDAIEAFKDYAENGQEPGLKTWAANTLPKLQAHLTRAQELRAVATGAKPG